MPKFLALASYTSEGIKGLTRAGGTARRAVADKLLKSLGGRLEGFYFAFGETPLMSSLTCRTTRLPPPSRWP